MARKLSFWEGIKAQFSTKCLVLIPIAVGINPHWRNSVLRTQAAAVPRHDRHHRRRMPVWSMVAALDRPADQSFPGTGSQPGLSSLCGGVGIVRFGRRLYDQGRTFTKKWGVDGHRLVCTFVNAISASLITTFVYGGATGVNGTSVLTATLVVAMKDILASVISSSLIENLLDKGITVAIAWVIVQKIPRRFLSQYAADSMGGSDNDALSDDDEEEDE